MQVRIHSVESMPGDTGRWRVRFESELGTATATWVGERPQPGAEYGAELEVPEVRWGQELREAPEGGPALGDEPGGVWIRGVLGQVWDGVGWIALGRWGFQVAIEGATEGAPRAGAVVIVRVPILELFDTRI